MAPPAVPQFSRTGMAGPFGKFEHEAKTDLDEQTHALWLRMCNSNNVTSAELLRDLIYLAVHQRTPAEIVGEGRRSLLQAAAARFRGGV